MLVVHACSVPFFGKLKELQDACREIVPAGFNSAMGPTVPGGVDFVPAVVLNGALKSHVVIKIEADYHADRAANIESRIRMIKEALNVLFPSWKFSVYVVFVDGWSSDIEDPTLDIDMSMDAAIKRIRAKA